MAEMYKVYIDNRYITISSQPDRMQNYCLFHKFHDQKDLSDQLTRFFNDKTKRCINIYSYKIDNLWSSFVEQFHFVEASGGIVLNSDNSIMLIKKYNKWDAPKGHFEPSETPEQCARREVSEECGIVCGEMLKILSPTYHIYLYDGEFYLKKSHWFLFRLEGSNIANPQVDEGITDASWIEVSSLHDLKDDIWKSVKDVINEVVYKHLPYL